MNKQFHPFLQSQPRIQKAAKPKPSGLYRIICLGGSTTEGKVNFSYPQELEKMLQTRFPQKNRGNQWRPLFLQYPAFNHPISFYLKDLDPDLILFFILLTTSCIHLQCLQCHLLLLKQITVISTEP